MRGSGYAIGEILIFLAIAAIIGFLIGWVVFYRRPIKGGDQLSAANPNHVRQLEGRTRAAESKLDRIEKRATALLATLEKTAPRRATTAASADAKSAKAEPPAEAPKGETKIAPAAAAPEGAGKHGPRDAEPAKAAASPGTEKDKAGTEKAAEAKEPAKAKEPAEATAARRDEAKKPDKVKEEVPAATKAAEAKPSAKPGETLLDETDDRLAKLEETLDKLTEKLAKLDED